MALVVLVKYPCTSVVNLISTSKFTNILSPWAGDSDGTKDLQRVATYCKSMHSDQGGSIRAWKCQMQKARMSETYT